MIEVKANKAGLVISGEVTACITKEMGFQMMENLRGVVLSSPAGKVCLISPPSCKVNGKSVKDSKDLIDTIMTATHPKTLF